MMTNGGACAPAHGLEVGAGWGRTLPKWGSGLYYARKILEILCENGALWGKIAHFAVNGVDGA